MSFTEYAESGTPLLTGDGSHKSKATFRLAETSMTIANTLRRAILTETRSVGFRADLTDPANPGVRINKNTSVIFNEMLAHRLTLLPLGVVRLDEFQPDRYECVLQKRNDTKGDGATLHVKASDFAVREKQEDGSWATLSAPATAALFPADPITRDTCLLVSLRPQWNPEQPPEEVDLVAYPVIGKGSDFMGFSPVSQASYGNTIDPDPVRQERAFYEWLGAYKKIVDPTTTAPEVLDKHRREWQTMAIQRCFVVDANGEPSSFDFTVESVGIRPVPDIVAEAIRAITDMVRPYASAETPLADLDITTQPPESRIHGLDLTFGGQEHTLGALLQAVITDIWLSGGAAPADAPITYVGYKVRHPLKKEFTLRLGFREGTATDATAAGAVARQIIAAAATKAVSIFEDLGRGWAAATGSGAAAAAAPEALEG